MSSPNEHQYSRDTSEGLHFSATRFTQEEISDADEAAPRQSPSQALHPSIPDQPSTGATPPISPRSSIPSSISHLLIDQQVGDAVTGHLPRSHEPNMLSSATAVSRMRSQLRSQEESRQSDASPALQPLGRGQHIINASSTSSIRPPIPPREAWYSFPPNYNRPSTPIESTPLPPPPRRPRPALPRLAEAVAPRLRGQAGPSTTPLPVATSDLREDLRYQPHHRESQVRRQQAQHTPPYQYRPREAISRSSTHYPRPPFPQSPPAGNITSGSSRQLSTGPEERSWFLPSLVPHEDMTAWSQSRVQSYRQGFEDGIQSVANGTIGFGEKQFHPPFKASRPGAPHQSSPSTRPMIDTRPVVAPAPPSMPSSHQVRSDTSHVPPTIVGPSTHRDPPDYQSYMPTTSSAGAIPRPMRTHPPPVDYHHSEHGFLNISSPPPRAPPQREKRQIIACQWCRERHMKCSGGHPCEACDNRKSGVQCVYADSVKRRGKGRKRSSNGSGASAESSVPATKRNRLGVGELVDKERQPGFDERNEEADEERGQSLISPGAKTDVTLKSEEHLERKGNLEDKDDET